MTSSWRNRHGGGVLMYASEQQIFNWLPLCSPNLEISVKLLDQRIYRPPSSHSDSLFDSVIHQRFHTFFLLVKCLTKAYTVHTAANSSRRMKEAGRIIFRHLKHYNHLEFCSPTNWLGILCEGNRRSVASAVIVRWNMHHYYWDFVNRSK